MTPDLLPIILPLVWGAILALAVFLYVLLGGYDLGLGVLFPLAPTHQDRDAMMNSVAPFWDGNETWLVLGGGGLLAAFPLAYAVMMPALYIPIIVMLIGLILRGVAFEFRFKSSAYRWTWDLAFAGGSIVAALMQGLIIGAFVQGFTVENNQVCRRSLRLAHAVCARHRARRRRRLCAALGRMADHEGRRGLARLGLYRRPLRADRGRGLHPHLQPVDAAASIRRSLRAGSRRRTW